jgi:hypothetical protein
LPEARRIDAALRSRSANCNVAESRFFPLIVQRCDIKCASGITFRITPRSSLSAAKLDDGILQHKTGIYFGSSVCG